jgi:hypothetical protein
MRPGPFQKGALPEASFRELTLRHLEGPFPGASFRELTLTTLKASCLKSSLSHLRCCPFLSLSLTARMRSQTECTSETSVETCHQADLPASTLLRRTSPIPLHVGGTSMYTPGRFPSVAVYRSHSMGPQPNRKQQKTAKPDTKKACSRQ